MNPKTPQLKVLSERQIEIIKENWATLNENPIESGQAIFYTFLTRHPEHKKRYPAFRDMSLDKLKDTPQIRAHCKKIMDFFRTTIGALGTENCKDILYTAVADNADYHGQKGITKEHFNEMRDVIMEVIATACKCDEEGKAAWDDLMDVMYHVTFNVLDELKFM